MGRLHAPVVYRLFSGRKDHDCIYHNFAGHFPVRNDFHTDWNTCRARHSRHEKRHQTIYLGATNIPLLNADIVTGISMMLLFVKFIDLGFVTVLLAHITFSIPYVILNVLPKMKQTNRSTYEAALDLGATPLYAFYKVTWPEIRPGVFSGFMMAVTMSLDDFPSPILPKEPGSIPSPPCSTQNFAKESNRNCMHFPRFCSLPFCSFFLPEMFIRGRSVLQPNKFSIGILFQPKGVLL